MMQNEMLSARRGNRAGIGFFRIFMRLLGVRHACNFVWFVALFYALFDREARRRARGYLETRFPEAAGFRLWLHTYKLLAAQGEALVVAGFFADHPWSAMARTEEHAAVIREALKSPRGLVIVTSHFGCWQAAMAGLADCGRRINLLVAPDANLAVHKQMALGGMAAAFHEIDVHGFMGGLPECLAAVERGEVVCIMGDRAGDAGTEWLLETPFFGKNSPFPVSPYWVAARASVPVIPLFVACERRPFRLHLVFGAPISPADCREGRLEPETLRPALERYVRELEAVAGRWPWQLFRFEA